MLGLSRLFGTSHNKAMAAWNDGAPLADGPLEARKEWAPYLQAWARAIEHNSMATLRPQLGAERVGWIDCPTFLAAFWNGVSICHLAAFLPPSEQRERMRPYVEGAAVAGNLEFFKSGLPFAFSLVGDILSNTHAIVHPDVLSWYRDKTCNDALSQSARDSRLDSCQKTIFRQLPWYSNNPSCVWIGRGSSFLHAIDDVCDAALEHQVVGHNFLKIFGHLMTHVVPEGQALAAIARIEQRMGPKMGSRIPAFIELPLVAMCSGHVLDDSPSALAIATMARDLQRANPAADFAQGRGPGWEALSLMTDLDNVVSPLQLYHAVRNVGFHRLAVAEPIEVDGGLFLGAEP